jgi:uncharacterized membrane protein YfcA
MRTCAAVIGIGFLIVGVMRFFALETLPGWENPEPLHGALHLVTGALWFASAWWRRGRLAGKANRWLGAFWLVTGIAGNLGWLDAVEALAFDDNAVHLVVGAVTTAVGWVGWWRARS